MDFKMRIETIQKRLIVLVVGLFLVFGLYVARLFVLQVSSASYYRTLAEEQYSSERILLPTRGEIKIADRNSAELFTVATSVKRKLVYVNPREVQDPNKVANTLAEILALQPADILPKVTDVARRYVVIKKQLNESEVAAIEKAELPGVNFDSEPQRYYPENNFLSHILGFVGYKGNNREGLYGLEESFESDLKGAAGTLAQEKDATGAWIFGGKRDFKPAQDGETLILTIDRSIQLKAEAVIEDAVIKNEADGGSIVVVNPKTGAVLAMASYPDFNPNEYNKVEDPGVYLNKVTLSPYEPGSIFKPLTMAAALNENKLTPETTYTDTGSVQIDGYTIQNSDKKAHGRQTMIQVLEESLNTGVIYAKDQIGNKSFFEYVQKFGFGKETGIEIKESKGNLDNIRANIAVNFHTASFGQGITVTPLQMVQAYTALANEGKMMRPFLVQTRISPDGKSFNTEPTMVSQVISQKAASQISAMLVNVTENGHGKRAKAPGYWVAGKTGTAQVPKKDGRGYEEDINIGSFIGYAPVEAPRFVALVRVNHPRNVKFAESTAAPAFGELAQFILNYYNIPPNRTETKN